MSPPRRRQASRSRRKPSKDPPSLLVLAQPSAETDDLLAPLLKRPDLCVLRVVSLGAAEVALRDIAVKLVLVCPETDSDTLAAVMDRADELRPGTPVLALRPRGDDHPSGWRGRTIGVLRAPVLPEVLDRTVGVVLGLGTHPLRGT